MARLYPPITESILPAFCLTLNSDNEKNDLIISISFNMNQAVSIADVKNIVLRLRTISTNTYLIKEDNIESRAIAFNLETGSATFHITKENNLEILNNYIHIGEYYKAQIAFEAINGTIGYYSTVATIKCIAKPSVIIANYDAKDANVFVNELIGEYIQDTKTGDNTEKVYSYRFQLWNDSNELIDDSGELLHNSSSDTSSFSSTDTFICYQNLTENKNYYIQYSITTINGFKMSSPKYAIILGEFVEPDEELILETENDFEEGRIKLDLSFNSNKDNISGNYLISRMSSKNNFMTWDEIERINLSSQKINKITLYDYTVEQGITYQYCIQQYNKKGLYSKRIAAIYPNNNNYIIADFEDMFLYDGQRQLKIRFNPKVSSFKNDLQEQKIDTIGSKYPFIFRNGNICYKEFPVAGLLSFSMDNNLLFLLEDEIRQAAILEEEKIRNKNSTVTVRQDKDLISENLMSERYFKLLVLDWLTNGKPKLFRSPAEGNYIVRLLNVNLSPKDELGRMIHEFTSTAYEIADYTQQNLNNLGIININNNLSITPHYSSIFINQDDFNSYEFLPLSLGSLELTDIEFLNFMPGDEIKLILKTTPDPLIIKIGQTGTYLYHQGENILGVYLKLCQDRINNIYPTDFQRQVNITGLTSSTQKFDAISNISLHTRIGDFFIGPIDNVFKTAIVGDSNTEFEKATNIYLTTDDNNKPIAEKIKLSEVIFLRAKKRLVIPIFRNQASVVGDNETFSLKNDALFTLTPYNNGYINYKSIVIPRENDFSEEEILNNFISEPGASTPRTIQDLTDYVIDQLNGNEDFLFQEYVYTTQAQSNRLYERHLISSPYIRWVPYETTWVKDSNPIANDNGYYDPHLKKWWSTSIDNEKEYDPSFYYNDTKITLDNINNEIIWYNISPPDSLRIGNGITMELIYRIQCIDYSVEDDYPEVLSKKQIYLNLKETYLNKINAYNLAQSQQKTIDLLLIQYQQKLNDLKDQDIQNILKDLYQTQKLLTNSTIEKYRDDISNYQIKTNNSLQSLRSDNQELFYDEENSNYFIENQEYFDYLSHFPLSDEEAYQSFLNNFQNEYNTFLGKIKEIKEANETNIQQLQEQNNIEQEELKSFDDQEDIVTVRDYINKLNLKAKRLISENNYNNNNEIFTIINDNDLKDKKIVLCDILNCYSDDQNIDIGLALEDTFFNNYKDVWEQYFDLNNDNPIIQRENSLYNQIKECAELENTNINDKISQETYTWNQDDYLTYFYLCKSDLTAELSNLQEFLNSRENYNKQDISQKITSLCNNLFSENEQQSLLKLCEAYFQTLSTGISIKQQYQKIQEYNIYKQSHPENKALIENIQIRLLNEIYNYPIETEEGITTFQEYQENLLQTFNPSLNPSDPDENYNNIEQQINIAKDIINEIQKTRKELVEIYNKIYYLKVYYKGTDNLIQIQSDKEKKYKSILKSLNIIFDLDTLEELYNNANQDIMNLQTLQEAMEENQKNSNNEELKQKLENLIQQLIYKQQIIEDQSNNNINNYWTEINTAWKEFLIVLKEYYIKYVKEKNN